MKMNTDNKKESHFDIYDKQRIVNLIKKALSENEFKILRDYDSELVAPKNKKEEDEEDLILEALAISLILINSENAVNKLQELLNVLQEDDDPTIVLDNLFSKYPSSEYSYMDDDKIVWQILKRFIEDEKYGGNKKGASNR